MAGNITFTMIKPGAYASNFSGKILDQILSGGFKLRAMKLVQLTEEQAKTFYKVHEQRPFYGELVKYMSSGPVIAAVLEKDNAVEAYRSFIGATNPADAAEGTIRKLYGESIQSNAVHGSDSDENAQIEANFFFSGFDRI